MTGVKTYHTGSLSSFQTLVNRTRLSFTLREASDMIRIHQLVTGLTKIHPETEKNRDVYFGGMLYFSESEL